MTTEQKELLLQISYWSISISACFALAGILLFSIGLLGSSLALAVLALVSMVVVTESERAERG